MDALRRMVDASDPATVRGLRDRVALVLGLALMGRRSELVALDVDDVTETPDGLEVLIRASKTAVRAMDRWKDNALVAPEVPAISRAGSTTPAGLRPAAIPASSVPIAPSAHVTRTRVG